MDLGALGNIHFNWEFVTALFSVVLIDLVLAGDNAVVIAMAVRSLPVAQRRKGIALGAGAAVLLRVLATFCVAQMLRVPFLKLVGGALILWIAVKLFVEGAPGKGAESQAGTIGQAVRIIVIADISMSLDNMLAVAGASKGSLFLLLFGLGLSIPLVVLTSNLLSILMDRYPVILYLGAAVLGRVGGEMMITDPVVENWLQPGAAMIYTVEGVFAAGVLGVGKLLVQRILRATQAVHGIGAQGQAPPPGPAAE